MLASETTVTVTLVGSSRFDRPGTIGLGGCAASRRGHGLGRDRRICGHGADTKSEAPVWWPGLVRNSLN